MGKFHRILEPGLNILLPVVDRIKYVQSLKEIAIDVPKQSAITVDNVTLGIDGVLYLRILDPYLCNFFLLTIVSVVAFTFRPYEIDFLIDLEFLVSIGT